MDPHPPTPSPPLPPPARPTLPLHCPAPQFSGAARRPQALGSPDLQSSRGLGTVRCTHSPDGDAAGLAPGAQLAASASEPQLQAVLGDGFSPPSLASREPPPSQHLTSGLWPCSDPKPAARVPAGGKLASLPDCGARAQQRGALPSLPPCFSGLFLAGGSIPLVFDHSLAFVVFSIMPFVVHREQGAGSALLAGGAWPGSRAGSVSTVFPGEGSGGLCRPPSGAEFSSWRFLTVNVDV